MQDNSHTEAGTEENGTFSGESKSVYEAIFREMEDAVFLIDVKNADDGYTFRYRRNNASHKQLTGLAEDELRGQTPAQLLGDEQGATVAGNYRRCVEQRETIEYEETLDLPGGTSHWQTKLTPITDNDQVTQLVGVARDITEQKEQEQTLQQIHRRFETVMETMSAAVFLKNAAGEYLVMNQACRELFNVDDGDISGLTDADIFPPDVAEKARRDDRRVLEDGEVIEIEETVPTATGTSVRLTRKSPVYDDDEVVALCGVSTDISEQKQREQQLQYLKERLELAVEGADLGIWDWDVTTDEVEFNEQWAEMLGYSREELDFSFDTWERLVHPDDRQSAMETLEAHIDGDTDLYDHEIRMQTKSSDWKWIRATGKVVERDDEGAAIRAAGVHIDINARKQAEQELRETQKQITDQNAALESFAEIVTDAERSFQQQMDELLELGTTYLDLDVGIFSEISGSEYTVQNVVDSTETIGPGDTFDLTDTYCSLVYEADGPVSFHSADDGGVKEHPAYEKQGLESYIGVPVFVDDQRYGTLSFSRPESREAQVTDAEELFVRIIAQWTGTERTRRQRQEELERTSQFLQETQEVAHIGGWEVDLQSETMRWSDELYRIHGLPLDANPTPDEGIEFYHPDDQATIREAFDRLTTEGTPYDLELRIVTADDEVRWVRTRGEPRYEDDEIVAVHGTFQDITERKERERELQRQNNRLNEFASVVSHDLRNPLNVAQARAALLQQQGNDEVQEHLTPLVTALERMENIVEDTLTLARQGETVGEMNAIPGVDLIGKCWAGVETGEATLEIDDEFTIRGDRNRVQHVFENLFRNAVEHGGENVTVRVGRCGENCFYVEDDGPGIPPGERDTVFEPGQTSTTEGTGFGLSIVNRIAEAHGWDVTITEGQAGGARFEFDTAGLVEE